MTFSIVGIDSNTGEMGIAVQSRFLAVGSVVPWAKANVGAIAIQAGSNTDQALKLFDLLANGYSAPDALKEVLNDDPGLDFRQIGIVDGQGKSIAFTGSACTPWSGHIIGDGYTCQGNILVSNDTVQAMALSFEGSNGKSLADRLVEALAAGQKAGGDSRGQQSAALLVVKEHGGFNSYGDRFVDLRVDDSFTPIEELKRILDLYKTTYFKPYVPSELEVDDTIIIRLKTIMRQAKIYYGRMTAEADDEFQNNIKSVAGKVGLQQFPQKGKIIEGSKLEALHKAIFELRKDIAQ